MKRIIAFLCVFVLCFSVCFATPAHAVQSEKFEMSEESDVSPCTEQCEWIYRINNGNYEKRLWSNTYGKWLTDWIYVGPAS